MHKAIRLGTIFGIAFTLDYSWFVVFILGTWSLARQYLPGTHPGWSLSTYWVSGAIISALFFASVVAHELAHSFVTRVYGAPVRDITLFIFGGAPRIGQEPRLPHEEVLIALTGSGISFVMATLLYGLWRLSVGSDGLLHALAGWLAWLNFMLVLVNLIPAFPLDGGRILRAVIWDGASNLRRATQIAIGLGWLVALSLIFYGSWLGIWQLRGGNWRAGWWVALIGLVLYSAITQSEQQLVEQDRRLLTSHTVRDVMLTGCPHILRRLTLDVLVDQVVRPSGQRYFLVMEGNHLHGLLTQERVAAVPQNRWTATRAEDVMISVANLTSVRPDGALTEALERMRAEDQRLFLVSDDGRPLGIISRETIVSFMHNQSGMAYRALYVPS